MHCIALLAHCCWCKGALCKGNDAHKIPQIRVCVSVYTQMKHNRITIAQHLITKYACFVIFNMRTTIQNRTKGIITSLRYTFFLVLFFFCTLIAASFLFHFRSTHHNFPLFFWLLHTVLCIKCLFIVFHIRPFFCSNKSVHLSTLCDCS